MNNYKEKYNELLEKLKLNEKEMKENPSVDKMKNRDEIKNEMKEILSHIENATENEINNGFNIIVPQETKTTEAKVNKPEIIQKEQITPMQEFSDNYRMATQLAKSTIIPQTYQNKPENVIVAIGMAQKIGLDPFTVMQNLNIVKGKTSWSGSFCRTLIEKSNKFTNLKLIFTGTKGTETYGCYMQGIDKETGEIINGPEVNLKMAKLEGWTSNSKWNNMPELMLSYRATSFFARVYVPEALNGVQTTEEIEDIFGTNKSTKREVADVL